MQVELEQHGNKGRFLIRKEDKVVAEMTYTMPSPEKMIIEHTEVSDELRGQNAGKKMVSAAVDYARSANIKIIPLCPFANAMFKKTPEFADTLFIP